jgi:hypothetical protein
VKVGDLVCYNCAGMRKHTMGYVMADRNMKNRYFFQIRWIKKGMIMPQISHDYYTMNKLTTPWWEARQPGLRIFWYERADVFDVIQ